MVVLYVVAVAVAERRCYEAIPVASDCLFGIRKEEEQAAPRQVPSAISKCDQLAWQNSTLSFCLWYDQIHTTKLKSPVWAPSLSLWWVQSVELSLLFWTSKQPSCTVYISCTPSCMTSRNIGIYLHPTREAPLQEQARKRYRLMWAFIRALDVRSPRSSWAPSWRIRSRTWSGQSSKRMRSSNKRGTRYLD